MTDDWKGEALIRSARPTGTEKRSEVSRMSFVVSKLRGTQLTSAESRHRHNALVRSALWRDKPGKSSET